MKSDRFLPEGAKAYLENLDADTESRKLESDPYAASYRALLRLAAGTTDDDKHDGAHALACATYGWMPTILKSFEPEAFNANKPVEQIREISSWDDAKKFVANMKEKAPINNSWVGTSKFMHFLNPEKFPIWDSKVARSFRSGKSSIGDGPPKASAGQVHTFCNEQSRYLSYMGFMRDIVERNPPDWIPTIQRKILTLHSYEPSKLRCIELMLFRRYS